MRVCHLDTCPVGVATQNPVLRERFTGKPEFVINFFEFLAEEVREYLARLGFRSLDEAIGRSEFIDVNRAISHWKADGLDLSPILAAPVAAPNASRRKSTQQNHELEKHFDHKLIEAFENSLQTGDANEVSLEVTNVDQAVGTMLGNEVTKRFGELGLPQSTLKVNLTGSAGQSFGAFIPRGVSLMLEGDSNDYVGKGLSGGSIVIRPPKTSVFAAEENIIAGNVIGYGATSGTMNIRGVVGERFMVRNSGATAVVEGVGDHALEYMTGGCVAILGETGRNLAAGMSGGVAYIYRLRADRVNREALENADVGLDSLEKADAETLHKLLSEHVRLTDSAVAARLLEKFDLEVKNFTRVLPNDYAAVLRIRNQATLDELDPDGDVVWKQILAVTGG
jgi:glutamate synthase (NADPH/NADH) large chain